MPKNPARNLRSWAAFLKVVGAAMGAAVVAAGAAAIKLGKEVVEQFGELEQTLAVLKLCLENMLHVSKKREKKPTRIWALSQSGYLATANKMGALFQGAGVDQQKKSGTY